MESSAALDVLASKISHCSLCGLCENRTKAVPGTGNPSADILFIGEGPGKSEDLAGVPFCGASGKLLDQLLESILLKREDVFITNIVKCRPPANRDPLPLEKDVCTQNYLVEQIELIQPKVIITLGRHALNYFIPNLKISEAHGRVFKHEGRIYIPLFHPAVALYNGGMRQTLAEDFKVIPKVLSKYEHFNQ